MATLAFQFASFRGHAACSGTDCLGLVLISLVMNILKNILTEDILLPKNILVEKTPQLIQLKILTTQCQSLRPCTVPKRNALKTL